MAENRVGTVCWDQRKEGKGTDGAVKKKKKRKVEDAINAGGGVKEKQG